MKVKIEITVDIDVDAWCDNYGTPDALVRRDVKEYAQNTITEHLREQGVLREEQS